MDDKMSVAMFEGKPCVYRGLRRHICENCGRLDSDHGFWENEVMTTGGMRHDDEMAAEFWQRVANETWNDDGRTR